MNCKHSLDRFINTPDLFKSAEDIEAMTYPYLTDDRLFGRRAHFSYTDFLMRRR